MTPEPECAFRLDVGAMAYYTELYSPSPFGIADGWILVVRPTPTPPHWRGEGQDATPLLYEMGRGWGEPFWKTYTTQASRAAPPHSASPHRAGVYSVSNPPGSAPN